MAVKCDNGVSLVMVKHIKHDRGICGGEFDRDVRIFIMEINIARVDHILAYRIGRDDVNMSLAFLLFGKAFLEIIGQRANLVCVGNKLTPALGECDGTAMLGLQKGKGEI